VHLKEVNLEALMLATRALALQFPDRTGRMPGQQQCYYKKQNFPDGVHGCIMGDALRMLGAEVPEDLEGKNIEQVFSLNLIAALSNCHMQWLREVQAVQDSGGKWSVAVYSADARFGNLNGLGSPYVRWTPTKDPADIFPTL
jgi:hypothetical protein